MPKKSKRRKSYTLSGPIAQPPADPRPVVRTASGAPGQNEIAVRARGIWDACGRPGGHDVDIWLVAERELARRLR